MTTPAVDSAPEAHSIRPLRYVARQPIFDREEKVYGYELLFRDGIENAFHGDREVASRATLDSTLLMGLDVLCDGKRAFVNCTRDTLIKGLVRLLPPEFTVVEVLETVPADPDDARQRYRKPACAGTGCTKLLGGGMAGPALFG